LVAAANQSEVQPPLAANARWAEYGLQLREGQCTAYFGVRGEQRREGEAPSYYNALEASTVVELVTRMLAAGAAQAGDIGIIATYRRQAFVLRQLLRERGLHQIRVGTVDDLQGQEMQIIFISTVLSRPESLPLARGTAAAADGGETGSNNVGFFRNPKRFNVAITRARSLLVVVGHPLVLWEDSSWRQLLKHCAAREGWFGAGQELLGEYLGRGNGTQFTPGGLLETAAGAGGAVAAEAAEPPSEEMEEMVSRLVEGLTLGAGLFSQLYPASMEDDQAANADELEYRIAL
jgi:hypothetical protein